MARSSACSEPTLLRERSLAACLEAVASTAEPVPAGGSVAALTGAAAAGLLALVCGVRAKRRPTDAVADLLARARELQRMLVELVDADAAVYRQLMAARRASQPGSSAMVDAARVPLEIAARCRDVVDLAGQVMPLAPAALAGDARTAALLAAAAADAALGLAEEDARHVQDAAEAGRLDEAISALRVRQQRLGPGHQ